MARKGRLFKGIRDSMREGTAALREGKKLVSRKVRVTKPKGKLFGKEAASVADFFWNVVPHRMYSDWRAKRIRGAILQALQIAYKRGLEEKKG